MTWSVFEAERQIRRYWDSPILTPLLEAAKFARLWTDLTYHLPPEHFPALLAQLKGLTVKQSQSTRLAPLPMVTMLAQKIDRRRRLKIPLPEATAEQRYRRTGTMHVRDVCKEMA